MDDQWQVLDSYGIPVFTGSLVDCGVWIDPVLGVVMDPDQNPFWPNLENVDVDRVTKNDDGSYTVEMYDFGNFGGGTLTVRKKTT